MSLNPILTTFINFSRSIPSLNPYLPNIQEDFVNFYDANKIAASSLYGFNHYSNNSNSISPDFLFHNLSLTNTFSKSSILNNYFWVDQSYLDAIENLNSDFSSLNTNPYENLTNIFSSSSNINNIYSPSSNNNEVKSLSHLIRANNIANSFNQRLLKINFEEVISNYIKLEKDYLINEFKKIAVKENEVKYPYFEVASKTIGFNFFEYQNMLEYEKSSSNVYVESVKVLTNHFQDFLNKIIPNLSIDSPTDFIKIKKIIIDSVTSKITSSSKSNKFKEIFELVNSSKNQSNAFLNNSFLNKNDLRIDRTIMESLNNSSSFGNDLIKEGFKEANIVKKHVKIHIENILKINNITRGKRYAENISQYVANRIFRKDLDGLFWLNTSVIEDEINSKKYTRIDSNIDSIILNLSPRKEDSLNKWINDSQSIPYNILETIISNPNSIINNDKNANEINLIKLILLENPNSPTTNEMNLFLREIAHLAFSNLKSNLLQNLSTNIDFSVIYQNEYWKKISTNILKDVFNNDKSGYFYNIIEDVQMGLKISSSSFSHLQKNIFTSEINTKLKTFFEIIKNNTKNGIDIDQMVSKTFFKIDNNLNSNLILKDIKNLYFDWLNNGIVDSSSIITKNNIKNKNQIIFDEDAAKNFIILKTFFKNYHQKQYESLISIDTAIEKSFSFLNGNKLNENQIKLLKNLYIFHKDNLLPIDIEILKNSGIFTDLELKNLKIDDAKLNEELENLNQIQWVETAQNYAMLVIGVVVFILGILMLIGRAIIRKRGSVKTIQIVMLAMGIVSIVSGSAISSYGIYQILGEK
ncbi:MAG: hypothetical protein K4H23_05050 [Mollicutes bacterium PWAP]|nr:hypothetical protein [Mollicutes bacterium PWAP]